MSKIIFFIIAVLMHSVHADEIHLLKEVEELINDNYVTDFNIKSFEEAAIKAGVASLDPHSNYIDKEDVKKFYDNLQNSYVGIGVEISMINNQLVILSIVEESPAEKVGMQVGDRIMKINEEYVQKIDQVRELLRGEIGSTVNILVLRENQQISFNVKRNKIRTKACSIKIIYNDQIAYIKIRNFSQNVADQVKEAYNKLPKHKGVILDLRYNAGGILNEAVNVTSLFLQANLNIVTIKSKKSLEQITSNGYDITHGLPLVVIINSISASASEIVAGALQDHKRAQILGVQSFGKGSVQKTFSLSNGGILKLTTSLYNTPNGYTIQGCGVRPDILVEDSMAIKSVEKLSFSENKLQNSIASDLISPNKEQNNIQLYRSVLGDEKFDFQLMRAMDVILTMNFLK